MKKEVISEKFKSWLITKKSACNALPEKETQKFCKELFNK
jgi:hypothetical protein